MSTKAVCFEYAAYTAVLALAAWFQVLSGLRLLALTIAWLTTAFAFWVIERKP
mgnify:CR=1 FL=1